MIQALSLTVILTIVVTLFFIVDFYFMFRFDPERTQDGKGWAWDYTLFTIGLGLLVLLQPLLLPQLSFIVDSPTSLGIQIVGGIGVFFSFVLHIWARMHLRHFYTERVEVQGDHQVIDSGPYALVRHPVFTSFFLLAGGVFLINPSATTLLVLIYAIWDFTKAAGQEENLLKKNISGYDDYMKRVPRFVPKLWRTN